MSSEDKNLLLLPHHEQQALCTTRLPYRQGRNLTAVKVYSINNESNHLLIFEVPSLNLRQEAKALFFKFGKLLQFSISKEHLGEDFTDTYHAVYEKIQSARLAKKFMDTKNFYGGSLHVCYAPEYETISETRNKLLQRQRDVLYRLRNLHKERDVGKKETESVTEDNSLNETNVKLNMGEVNTILINNEVTRKRVNNDNIVIEKKFKPCFVPKEIKTPDNNNQCDTSYNLGEDNAIDIIDFTSSESETLTNINECLNYKNFGNEVVRNVELKPVNRIKFNLSNKKLELYFWILFYLIFFD